MALWDRLRGSAASRQAPAPRNAYQGNGGGVIINTPQELEAALRGEAGTAAGVSVTADGSLGIAAVYACVRIISGAVATLPLHVKRRVDERTRNDASEEPLWVLLRRRPNRWQTPSTFRRTLQVHLLLRGNAYAQIVRGTGGRIIALNPLHPDRVTVQQGDDLSLRYTYVRPDGGKVEFKQADVFHLVGLSLDGIAGVSVIKYARETIGLSLAMEKHGASVFKNGARASLVLKHPGKLGQEGLAFLRSTLEQYRAGGEAEGKALVLEEGMETAPLSMTAEDAQWIESRKFSRSDIAMFFGVPPHMIGDTEKSTSWGTGIEQQSIGFTTYTLEDWLTSWEETINRDLVPEGAQDLYARFNRAAIVKGDIAARWESYVKALQWGVMSPNEVRALEDMNPRTDGDIFYSPPNTAGDQKGKSNEPAQAAKG